MRSAWHKLLLYIIIMLPPALSRADNIAFTENDIEIRQLTDTSGLSWDQIATVCPAAGGACQGSIGGVSFTGWDWMTQAQLTAFITGAPFDLTDGGNFYQFASTIAPGILELDKYFQPTRLFGGISYMFAGWTAGPAPYYNSLGYEEASGGVFYDLDNSDYYINIGELGSLPEYISTYYQTGAWLDRPVPEPSAWAFLLMGTGWIGSVLRRRRAEN